MLHEVRCVDTKHAVAFNSSRIFAWQCLLTALFVLQAFCSKLESQLGELSEEADAVVRHQKLFGHCFSDFTELKDAKTEIEAKALLWNARGDAADLIELWQQSPLSQVFTTHCGYSAYIQQQHQVLYRSGRCTEPAFPENVPPRPNKHVGLGQCLGFPVMHFHLAACCWPNPEGPCTIVLQSN